METKPYNLQSPEQIAKDYGGNKQKIAEAMQMGVLDPTAGTMAGMFIDRMRSAAQMEAAPQQTVAQQVMAPQQQMPPQGAPQGATPPGAGAMPPAPPAGLGATPEAAAMAPQMPPMGAPPPQGMPGMAEGGMVPPYASGGGLSDMPLPDGMFDEPSNGGFNDGYAGGGMVAFADAGSVKAKGIAALLANPPEEEEEETIYSSPEEVVAEQSGAIVASGEKAPTVNPLSMQGKAFAPSPDILARFKQNVLGSSDLADELAPRSTKRAQQLEALLDEEMSPEALKSRRKGDMWMALGQIGAKMATTPGSLLQAASAGIGEALPGIAASAKERRGAKRNLVKELLSEERLSNKELADRFNTSLDMVVKGIVPLEEAFQDRNFRDRWETLGRDSQERIAKLNAAAGIQSQQISTSGQIQVGGMDLSARRGAFYSSTLDDFRKNAATDPEYLKIVKSKGINAGLSYLQNEADKVTTRVFGKGAVDLGSY
jgi:hypothetical protein